MATQGIPKQVDFSIVEEIWGKTLLSDGTIVDTRVILQDLLVLSEDPFMGPAVSLGPIIAVRTKATPEMIEKFKGKAIRKEIIFPFTAEAGYEKIDVERNIKPTISTYLFNEYLLTITLEIIFVARNNLYRSENGAPLYMLRWSIAPKVTKAKAST